MSVKWYQTVRNYDPKKVRYEKNSLPSETIPDETMSVRELFNRYANGQNLGAPIRPLTALQNPALPINWDKMDISEKYDFAAEHKIKLTEAQKAFNQQREDNEAEENRKRIIQEYEASKQQNENSAASPVGDAKQARAQTQKPE